MTAVAEAEAELLTPTVRRSLRRALFWVLGAVVVLGVGFVILVLQRAAEGPANVLDPEAAAPHGARAVAQVLGAQGVEVVISHSLDDTAEAVDGREATILLHDRYGDLEEGQLQRLLGLSDRLVVLAPGFLEAEVLAPAVAHAGALVTTPITLTAECDDPTAARSGLIRVDGAGYRIVDGSAEAVGCFPGEDDSAFALVETTTGGTRVAVLGTAEILRNDLVTEAGNAALALGLLGEDPLLVWYEPGIDDLRGELPPTLQELTGPWVTPLAILLVLVAIAAGVWQGRRFGPLVVERLPVEVRARETMEGRARLYARGDARRHALDALRSGAVARLADRLGLPRSAGVDELVLALQSLTGRDRSAIEDLLRSGDPATDALLLQYSDALRLLEDEVARLTGAAALRKEER